MNRSDQYQKLEPENSRFLASSGIATIFVLVSLCPLCLCDLVVK